jgi:hypothetical protein
LWRRREKMRKRNQEKELRSELENVINSYSPASNHYYN